ncbi:hypothetical protein LSAT2_022479 [Lamellibrachia satsuma]|nr:hypothetical protein LSAT2_022479 [Lamellibrachia satsuma]
MAQFRYVLLFVCVFVCVLAVLVTADVQTSAPESTASEVEPESTATESATTPTPNDAKSVVYSLSLLAGSALYSLLA